jgi:methionyl aminopeptidase
LERIAGPDRTADGIRLHRQGDFEGMRAAGRLAAETLDMIAAHVAPGAVTGDLDRIIHDFMVAHGARPATLGYRGYTKSSCISINHVVCHGIPGDKTLRDGDILNIDVTVILDGWYGDSSRMYVAGRANRRAERLIDVTHEALMRGVGAVKPGATFGDIGAAIQRYVEAERCSVVRDFCGHGLGRVFHDAPNVLHYGREGSGPTLRPGMFFTIEPMVNLGRPETKILADGWTAVTRDKSLSAQFEHSVGVTEDGVEVFTLSPAGRFHPTWDR